MCTYMHIEHINFSRDKNVPNFHKNEVSYMHLIEETALTTSALIHGMMKTLCTYFS